MLAPPACPASAAPAFGGRAPALLSAGIALLLPGGVMRSPIRGLASSDGEEGSDRTPLLQSTPRVEAGEPRSCPRAGVARIPALCQWDQGCLGVKGLEEGKPKREGTRGGGVRSVPRLVPACPGTQTPLWGLAGTGRPGRAGGSGEASAGAAPRGLGGRCWAPRALDSWQFSTVSSEGPRGRMYCSRTCKSMAKGPGGRPGVRAD